MKEVLKRCEETHDIPQRAAKAYRIKQWCHGHHLWFLNVKSKSISHNLDINPFYGIGFHREVHRSLLILQYLPVNLWGTATAPASYEGQSLLGLAILKTCAQKTKNFGKFWSEKYMRQHHTLPNTFREGRNHNQTWFKSSSLNVCLAQRILAYYPLLRNYMCYSILCNCS